MEEYKEQMDKLFQQYQSLLQQLSTIYLKNNNDNSQFDYEMISSSTYIDNNINTTNVNSSEIQFPVTQTDCMKLCQDSSCYGASYDITTQTCHLLHTKGELIFSNDSNSIVYLRKDLYILYQLDDINEEMLTLNNKMNNEIHNHVTILYKTKEEQNQLKKILNKNQYLLQKEKRKLNELINQYEDWNAGYDDLSLQVDSNYSQYIVMLIIFIIICIISFLLLSTTPYFNNR